MFGLDLAPGSDNVRAVVVKKPIRALIVEDSEFDARILVNTLRQGGYDAQFRRVETAESMRDALSAQTWDVVLSDYNLPGFSAPEALRVLQDTALDLPFIIVSGGIGEDIAVAAMKAGAHDYLMKGNLARLVPAVEREMREAASRQSGRLAEAALRDSEQRNRLLWENSTDAVLMMDPDGTVRFANPAVARVFGYETHRVVEQNFTRLLTEEERSKFSGWAVGCLAQTRGGPGCQSVLTVGRHRLQREVFLEIGFTDVQLKGRTYLVAFVRDITERRLAEQESRLLQGISLAVSTAPDLDSALAAVLQAVCQTTGWSLGQAWLPSADDLTLECSPGWFGTLESLNEFHAVSESMRFRRGEGLPGEAWATLQPVWVDDVSVSGGPRAPEARAAGIVAAAGVPVLVDQTAVAVIEFFLTARRQEDTRLLKLLAATGAQLGVAVQQKRAEQELRANAQEFLAARDIQERLFPEAPPKLPGFDIAGRSRAASAAGGDYFDYVPLLGGRWGIAVGDVTGHGIGPALLMAETRAYLRALARTHESVDAILTAANRVLADDIGSERFITMLLVALDPDSRTLTYVNAGHPPAYVLDRTGEIRTRLTRSGVPLGIRPDTPYPPAGSVPLVPGDTILIFTDGIEEAMRMDDTMFGEERALDVIRSHLGQPAEVMVDALYRAVKDFAGDAPQLDDATAVIVRVL